MFLSGIVVFETPKALGGRSYIKAGNILFWYRDCDCTGNVYDTGGKPQIGDKVFFAPGCFASDMQNADTAEKYSDRVFHAGNVERTFESNHQLCVGKCAEAHQQGLAFDFESDQTRRDGYHAEIAQDVAIEKEKRSYKKPGV